MHSSNVRGLAGPRSSRSDDRARSPFRFRPVRVASDDLRSWRGATLRYFRPSSSLPHRGRRGARARRTVAPRRASARIVDGDVLVCPFHAWRWSGDGLRRHPLREAHPAEGARARMAGGRASGAILCGTTERRSAHVRRAAAPDSRIRRLPSSAMSSPSRPASRESPRTPTIRRTSPPCTAFRPAREQRALSKAPVRLPRTAAKFETPRARSRRRSAAFYGPGVGHPGRAACRTGSSSADADRRGARPRALAVHGPGRRGRPSAVGVAFAREFVRQFHQDIPTGD
jgi:hypothetical protein